MNGLIELNKEDLDSFRKTQLRLLDAFKSICDKHELTYWIDFGTLLGAVRSKGFIPWDDDLDISMPMDDYNKFLEIAEKELPYDIFLQTPKTDPTFRECFTKLRDCYSTMIEHHETEEWLKTHQYHRGIFIDIFPSYLYPKMPRLFRKILMRTTVRSRSKAVVFKRNVFINYSIYIICKFFWLILSIFKKEYYGMTPEDNGYMFVIPLSKLYPLSQIEFEGKFYAAPQDPHGHLSCIYRDHMTPPPVEKRVPHATTILPHKPCNHPRALSKKQ